MISPLDKQLKEDLDNLSTILDKTKQLNYQFLESIRDRPVCAPYDKQVIKESDNEDRVEDEGIGAIKTLEYFYQRFGDGISGSVGPRYLGFVVGGVTPAALSGDWTCSTIDQNTQLTGDTVSAAIEHQTIRQLLSLLGLKNASEDGESFTGSFVTGATMANFVGLAIARQWIGQNQGIDVAENGMDGVKIRLLTASAHSSSVKSLSMLGIGRNKLQMIPTTHDSEEMDMEQLEKVLQNDHQHIPTIVLASAGTVNTVCFDNLTRLFELRDRYGFWVHLDAAFGGVVGCSPTYRHLLNGWEKSDSITIDCHKYLNTPYDSACQFVKRKHLPLQIQVFKNQSPYLADPVCRPDNYLHLTPENSRRFRALPLWMSLKAYGRQGMINIVDRNIELAQSLGKWMVNGDGDTQDKPQRLFKLLSPVHLNVVCFALDGFDVEDTDKLKQLRNRYLELLDQHGKVRCTPTFYNGQPGIRAAFVNWMTEATDLTICIDSFKHCRLQLENEFKK